MDENEKSEITRILREWSDGDSEAADRLLSAVYDELRRQARIFMSRERINHTLQPTALVHEAFAKLLETSGIDWQNRGHFFAIASRLMRRILVDHARAHAAGKRGNGAVVFSLDSLDLPVESRAESLLIFNDTLDRLAALDAQQAKVVEMRFFGGMSNPEIAAALSISERTVAREWRSAQLWLLREFRST